MHQNSWHYDIFYYAERRKEWEEQVDPEMATSAAEQFEGERQLSAGGNDETLQSQSQAPGAEAPTTTSEEDKMQTSQLSLPRHHQKITRFDGKAPWEAHLAQFHIIANGWGDFEKAHYLSNSIEGPALSMLANLSPEDRMDFPKLVAALENRFGAKHQQQQSRVLLNTMKRKKSEPL